MIWLSQLLHVVQFVVWAGTYVLIIIESERDKTYGVPFLAICANLSWEIIFSIAFLKPSDRLGVAVWALLDLVIFSQYLRFWRTDYPKNLSPRMFVPMVFVSAFFTFAIILSSMFYLPDEDPSHLYKGTIIAYSTNFMMSVLFVSMFWRRQNLAGQSFYIALLKLLGTQMDFASDSLLHLVPWVVNWLCLGSFVFDGLYAVLVYQRYSSLGGNPWADLLKRKAVLAHASGG